MLIVSSQLAAAIHLLSVLVAVTTGTVKGMDESGLISSPSSSEPAGPMLEIVNMRVPQVVEDGSQSSVILDCEYSLRSSDKRSELVVQWYFQNGTTPVYQWIPGKRPQDLGILQGRLNLEHRASGDPYERYRALEILRPTYELSGLYKCKVMTVEDEAIAARTMIVYSPARKVEIFHQKMSYDTVNVTCVAEGVYPRPRLQLYRKDRPAAEMEGIPAEVVHRRGLYDVTLSRIIQDRSLRQETIFECVLTIPLTPYQITRSLIYYPGSALPVRSSSNSAAVGGFQRHQSWCGGVGGVSYLVLIALLLVFARQSP